MEVTEQVNEWLSAHDARWTKYYCQPIARHPLAPAIASRIHAQQAAFQANCIVVPDVTFWDRIDWLYMFRIRILLRQNRDNIDFNWSERSESIFVCLLSERRT